MKKLMAAVAAMAAMAGYGWDVENVTDLTNALVQINAGLSDDTVINLAPGTYDVSGVSMDVNGLLYISKSMTIRGTDGTSWRTTSDGNTKTVIDGGDVHCIFRYNISDTKIKATFSNITFVRGNAKKMPDVTGGDTYPRGGAIGNNNYSGALSTATNCVFRDCYAAGQGGATMKCNTYDCCFSNCWANGDAGASIAQDYAVGCRYEACRTLSGGGSAQRNVTNVRNCEFIRCSGGYAGLCGSNTFTIDGCLCVSNTASPGCFTRNSDGGTFGNTVKNTTFIGNNGGCVHNISLVTNCVFLANYATSDTASACVLGASNIVKVVDCVFSNNEQRASSGYGAAARGPNTDNEARLPTLKDCRFFGNAANGSSGRGGAVAWCSISNCVFNGDSATLHGGAAYGCFARDCRFQDCRSTKTGSMDYGGGGASQMPLVTNCLFHGCQAYIGGGVSYCTNVVDCLFDACYAGARGGGAVNSEVTDCVFSNCTVGTTWQDGAGGAGMRNIAGDPTCTARRCMFVECCSTVTNRHRTGTAMMNVYDCTYIGCGCYGRNSSFSATRCRFLGGAVAGGVGFDPTSSNPQHYIARSTVCTNCLFNGADSNYTVSDVSLLVNCTFVSNNLARFRGGQNVGGPCTMVNCIFKDNFANADGSGVCDLVGYGNWYLTNCVVTTYKWGTVKVMQGQVQATKEQLFYSPMSRNYDPENPYKPKKSSPARNAGFPIAWPEDATDLVGQPRVNGTAVDIGCYEGWYPECGGFLLIR